jgi:uncharacterized protein YbjT (DUF2867 family)
VYISVWNAKPDSPPKPMKESVYVKSQVEAFLQSSSLNWTVLRSPSSMQTFFSMRIKNTMIIPGSKDVAIPCVSAADVAHIAVQTLYRTDHSHRVFE